MASPIAPLGWNQTSHYALVRALDDGTSRIDRYHVLTGDEALRDGHWYSARAPGLAFGSLPLYEGLEATGATHHLRSRIGGRGNSEIVWLLGIWAATLPAVALMLVVRRVAERVQPGYGTLAAVTLGLGTIVLPFSTVLFAHVLAATLGFAAFALLLGERRRRGPPRLAACAAAGLCVGYAVTTEYALALVGLVLAAYVLSGRDRLRQFAAYAAGAVFGALPLALYDVWTYGSPTHVAYSDIPLNHSGFFGIGAPSARAALQLLLASRGMFTLAPIVILGAAGTYLLYRRGQRAEAYVVTAVAILFLAYNAGYFLPFGGAAPGPRFLIATLPFLCFPLGVAFKRWPGPAIALAAISVVTLGIVTAVTPLPIHNPNLDIWTRRLEHGHLDPTVATLLGVHNKQLAMIPVLVAALVAVTLAVRSTPSLHLTWRSVASGAVAAVGWAAFAMVGPHVLRLDTPPTGYPLVHLALYALGGGLLALLAIRALTVLRQRSATAETGDRSEWAAA